jgi:hypothetical protein
MKHMILGILAIIAAAPAVWAQSAESPTYSVGDTWKRSHGQELKVVSVDDQGTTLSGVLLDCTTCLGRVDKNLALKDVTTADGKSVDVTNVRSVLIGSNWKFYEWPLEVGKSWSTSGMGYFKGQSQRFEIDFIVRAYEDVKTKAGAFRAYKIEQTWSNPGPYGSHWTNTWWYAPEVKSVVKATSTNRNSTDWELVSYSVK